MTPVLRFPPARPRPAPGRARHRAPRADTARFLPALPTLRPEHLVPHAPGLRPARLPFPLGASAGPTRRYYLARAAIVHGLRAQHLPNGAVALLPAYHHGVEVEAVRAAGLEVRFYRVTRRLQADLDDVAARLDRLGARARVLYLTHFCGFPGPIEEARRLCDARGLVLVEDCALALLSRASDATPLGRTGDLAVFCLYKSVPVPHGGVLVSPRMPPPAPSSPPFLATSSHLFGSLLRGLELRHPLAAVAALRRLLRRAGRAVPTASRRPTGGQHLRPEELDLGASRLVDLVLARQPWEAIVARRRRNYARLRERLHGLGDVPTGELLPGTCPLFVPVSVAERNRVLGTLWARGVEAVDLWRHGHEPEGAFADVAALRRHLIELPCHQDLDDDGIDEVAAAFEEVLAR